MSHDSLRNKGNSNEQLKAKIRRLVNEVGVPVGRKLAEEEPSLTKSELTKKAQELVQKSGYNKLEKLHIFLGIKKGYREALEKHQ